MISRRGLLKAAGGMVGAGVVASGCAGKTGSWEQGRRRPNVVFVFADQWRGQAVGYAGDANVRTPVLDKLSRESVRFTTAVATCPVCCPWRASLMTGRYPLTHGVFLNDVQLNREAVSIAQAFGGAGYRTGYIGKWHLDGRGRSSFIPRERRQGFEHWRVLECTHDYNRSAYWGDEQVKRVWQGYDAAAQTQEARRYIREREKGRPFALFVSWGPPHNPYGTAPEEFRRMYEAGKLVLRQNVPREMEAEARRDLAGYYAHCSALDGCVGELLGTLKEEGLEEDTIFVFTSDHGDMLGSQGMMRKQRPYDEAILVPLLVRWPRVGRREIGEPMGVEDLMPTLLGLCGVEIPKTVEGRDWSGVVRGEKNAGDEAALIACYTPFGEWARANGGREYRGLRTRRWTYVRDLKGPWMMFDNERDALQKRNLVGLAEYAGVRRELEGRLRAKLGERGDEFREGRYYVEKWGYVTDATGTVRYTG
ncbi:MAG: sulfatase [Planctomycetota bacterium]|nr:sulfatase [Planctomycetota bacterium]